MIEPSDKFVLSIKEMIKEKTGKEPSHQEAWEGANNLIGFFELLLKIDMKLKAARKDLVSALKRIAGKNYGSLKRTDFRATADN
jgi:hypothetical protein